MGLTTHWHRAGKRDGLRARLDHTGDRVEVSDPEGNALVVELPVWAAFIEAVKRDDFE